MYKTCMQFQPEIEDRVEVVCHETRKQDRTFKYFIVPSQMKERYLVLVVQSKTKDQAHQRGMWLTKKVFKEYDLLYWVKKQ